MLSYLKDGSQVPAAAEMDQQGEAPGGQTEFLTVAGHGKKLQQSTILLAVLFAVGAAGVWFMIKKTAPASASAATSQDQVQLEAALAQLKTMKTEMDSQMDSVVGKFYQFSNVDQIHVNELKKNPFRREHEYTAIAEDTTEEARRAHQRRLAEQAQQESQSLQLWSITSTPRGMCCMIGDALLYEGDTINEMTVTSIQAKKVVLDYKGIPVELKID